MKGLAKIAIGACAVIVLAIAALFLLRGGGEKAKVEAMLRQAVADGNAGDAERCIAIIDPNYHDAEGLTYADVCALVRRWVGPGKWKKADLQSMEVGVDGDTASATLRLWMEASDPREFMGREAPIKLHLQLAKKDGAWKITGHRVEMR